jgi:hypothetical protein
MSFTRFQEGSKFKSAGLCECSKLNWSRLRGRHIHQTLQQCQGGQLLGSVINSYRQVFQQPQSAVQIRVFKICEEYVLSRSAEVYAEALRWICGTQRLSDNDNDIIIILVVNNNSSSNNNNENENENDINKLYIK